METMFCDLCSYKRDGQARSIVLSEAHILVKVVTPEVGELASHQLRLFKAKYPGRESNPRSPD